MAFSKAMAHWAEQQIRNRFYRQFGYILPLDTPQTLREKLFTRMVLLHQRHCRRYTLLSDKIAVREYVKHCIGPDYLSPIGWTGRDPADAPLEHYNNGHWIAKTNHGCGGHRVIRPGSEAELRSHFQQQLQQNYYWMALEAQYFDIQPQLYIEQLVQGSNQSPPLSYRLWCFGGRAEMIQVDDGSLHNPFYDRNWSRLNLSYRHGKQAAYCCPEPTNLKTMITLAEALAAPFGFVRVDLYNLDGRIMFSELTFTPLAGDLWMEPAESDYQLGALWPNDLLV